MGAVLQKADIALTGQLRYPADGAGLAEKMRGQDGAGFAGNFGRNVFRAGIVGLGINFAKYRPITEQLCHQGHYRKSKHGENDFGTFFQP